METTKTDMRETAQAQDAYEMAEAAWLEASMRLREHCEDTGARLGTAVLEAHPYFTSAEVDLEDGRILLKAKRGYRASLYLDRGVLTVGDAGLLADDMPARDVNHAHMAAVAALLADAATIGTIERTLTEGGAEYARLDALIREAEEAKEEAWMAVA